MSHIRTVLGDVAAGLLGRTNYHEHLFQVSPLLIGDELDDELRSAAEASLLGRSGFDAMVDMTPMGLGRRPEALARISADTGLMVVATTGVHRDEHYAVDSWVRALSEQELRDRFVSDIRNGMPREDASQDSGTALHQGLPVRAGMLKAGIGYWSVSSFERRVLSAVAAAHVETGAPVTVHLEHGSAAFEVLELLSGDGVRANAVVLAHIDRNPDPGLHSELAAAGAYLGYDGFGRSRTWPDSVLLECAQRVAESGQANRIVIGGDVARRTRYLAYGGMPGLQYLGLKVIPRLETILGADLLQEVLVENPARLLARFRPAPD
ncbi:aryldialkylphosphatase [Cryobacterium glaciale]|uniref:Aryldialkylphosphatase n=1 Tax=Cryobacterium glaciale TaxID=1259145 RepID=A0A4R8V444_9MICO|nr:aryldialkylphosphatase [Cryobacterium glaciale]TFB76680.1 aryldialkylphosphatase [Cryobacterium glaciale]